MTLQEIYGRKSLFSLFSTGKTASSTAKVRLYAYDLDTSSCIGSVTDSKEDMAVIATAQFRRSVRESVEAGHNVAMMHNHPGSSMPSGRDIESLFNSRSSFGIIACHDGSLLRYGIENREIVKYNISDIGALKEKLLRIRSANASRGKTEGDMFSLLESEVGVKIERFVFAE